MAIARNPLRETIWQIILIFINLNILWIFFGGGYYDYITRWDVLILAFRNIVLILVSLGAVLGIIKSFRNIFIKK